MRPIQKMIFLLAILFVPSCFFAQKRELGKVTVEELKQARHAADTSASASVIFEKGKTSFFYSAGRYIITEVEVKIKIYKQDGVELANEKILYDISGSDKESVRFSKAITYNLVNGAIEKTKLGSDGEFDEKVNKYYSMKKISMPNVKVGSIIEYKYEIKSPYYYNLPAWKFQREIPVDYSEYSTIIPQYFTYNTMIKGFFTPKVTNSLSPDNLKVTTYVLEQLPAIRPEAYVNNIDNYTATLIHELSFTSFPGSIVRTYATTWEAVTNSIYKHDGFGDEMKKTGYFEEAITPLVSSLSNRNEKINAVFSYVKDYMTWNEYYGYSCQDGVKTAYKNHTGNAAEINLMLIAMLRHAGLNANPVLVSTRNHGIPLYPSQSAFNYVVCGVRNDSNEMTLLDATSKNAQLNIMPFRVLNWVGRLIKDDGTSIDIDLMPKTNSKEVTNLIATLDQEGKVSGTMRKLHYDYNAFYFREKYANVAKETYIEKLEKDDAGIEVVEYAFQNKTDLSKPIVENLIFRHNEIVEIIGGRMYFSPLLFLGQGKNPFTLETREYPVDFMFPYQNKLNVTLTIPDGYVIETLPESVGLGIQDNVGMFKYSIVQNGNQLQIVFTEEINQPIIGADYYNALKNYFKTMIDKQNEKIVLKKV